MTSLLVRPGALGDAIVSLPLVAALQGAAGGGVDILGRPGSWRFLPSVSASLRVHDIDGLGWLGLFAARPLAPDAAQVLGRAERVVAVVRGGSPLLDGLARAGRADVLHIEPPRLHDRARSADDHAAARLLRLWLHHAPATPVGPIDARTAAWRRPSAAEVALAERELDGALPDRPRLAVHPGSGSAAKCWPVERFATAIRRFVEVTGGGGVLLLGGPADHDVAARLRASLPEGLRAALSLDEPPRRIAALARCCDVFLGNDSGLGHVVAPHVPLVVLFGPTDPGVWRPLGPDVRVLRAPGGRLADLAVGPVVAALSTALAQSRPRTPS